MNYPALRAELAKPAYAGMTDAEIVAALNAPTAGPSAPASLAAILGYLRSNGLWLPIKAAGTSGSNPGAVAALDIFQDGHTDSIDLTLPAATALLDALVSGSLLTSAQSAALMALCATTTSIAAGLGGVVTEAELAAARKWG